ncbi:MAG: hypothetical protein WDZ93_00675 [Candidatus Paceibacterota bacterium]
MNIVYGVGVVVGVMLAGGEHVETATQLMATIGGLLLAGVSALAFFHS